MKILLKALSEFQNEVPVIIKKTEGYGYNYADISDIFAIIRPILTDKGLSFTQVLDGKNLKTILFHIESGEILEGTVEIDTTVKLGGMNAYQVFGSAVTYFRRYSLSCMLGLVTDEDNDAKEKEPEKKAPAKKTPPVKIERKPISIANFEKSLKGTIPQVVNVINKYELTKDQREQLTVKLAELKKIRKESKTTDK